MQESLPQRGESVQVYNGPGLDLPGAHLEDKASQPGPGYYGAPMSAVQVLFMLPQSTLQCCSVRGAQVLVDIETL